MATRKTAKSAGKKKAQRPRTGGVKAPSAAKPSRPKQRVAAATTLLGTYRSKRDFGKTPEPQGDGPSRWKKDHNPIFVVQKHAARALHYDFRLEIDGVLKSWAVPKGPSLDPGDKRLAVQTEDHPLDYADFEGVIPPGEYGAGVVIVWDAGPYRNLKPEAPMSEWLRRGHIEVWLEGKKIRGGYALIHSRLGGQEKNWLLVKMRDEIASAKLDPVTTQPESVMTGRTLEQVAARAGARERSARRA